MCAVVIQHEMNVQFWLHRCVNLIKETKELLMHYPKPGAGDFAVAERAISEKVVFGTRQSGVIVFSLAFGLRRMPPHFLAPTAEIERRTIDPQSMPPVEARSADQAFEPIRFVFAVRPESPERR